MANRTYEIMEVEMRGRKASEPQHETADGNLGVAWFLRDGALVGINWKQGLVLAGNCFNVSVGTFDTPIVGGGNGTVLDADQPELVIDVPSGVSMIPLRVRVDCQVPADQDGDEVQILLAIDRTAISSATATNGTVETPINMRGNGPANSLCRPVSAITTNLTAAPTLSMELAHPVKIINIVTSGITQGELGLNYDPQACPVLVGPATLVIYWGGTQAVSGFASVDYAEWVTNKVA